MITVFHALNSIEAHGVKIRLLGEGLEAQVEGDYLQGAMGELPALGMIRVVVPEAQAERARQLLENWQQEPLDDDSWIPSELL